MRDQTIDGQEFWADAPLVAGAQIRFRPVGDIDVNGLAQHFPNADVKHHPDGLVTVFAPDTASFPRSAVEEWCLKQGIAHAGVRSERIRRRNLKLMPTSSIDFLIQEVMGYALTRLVTRMQSIRVFYPERDEMMQQVAEWILDAARRFDPVNPGGFRRYLGSRLGTYVDTMPRATGGRRGADWELSRSRAMTTLRQRGCGQTTELIVIEMAKEMQCSQEEAYRRLKVAEGLAAIRAPHSIDAPIGGEEDGLTMGSILPDTDDSPEDVVVKQMQSAQITRLLAAAGRENPLGMVVTYLNMWGEGQTNQGLAQSLGVPLASIGNARERVHEGLRKSLSEYQ